MHVAETLFKNPEKKKLKITAPSYALQKSANQALFVI